jgi:uncharacterized membrane protein YbhN (UPF0104 family)
LTSPLPAWRRALRSAWLGVVAVALVVVLRRHGTDVMRAAKSVPLPLLALATLAMTAGVAASAMVWRALLTGLGHRLPVRAGARVFFLGQIGKYVPGSVWPVLAQMELGRDYGVPAAVSAAAFALFMVIHLLSAAVVAALALPAAGLAAAWWAFTAVPAVLLLLLSAPLRAGLRLGGRVLRRPMPPLPSPRALMAAAGWAAVMWACYGVHLWLLARGAGAPVDAVAAAGVFALAWSAGFVFVIAPAGAGAREAVLLGLLGGLAPAGVLLAVALLSRLAGTVADALWAAVALLLPKRRG